jgi:hypothetical protein
LDLQQLLRLRLFQPELVVPPEDLHKMYFANALELKPHDVPGTRGQSEKRGDFFDVLLLVPRWVQLSEVF